jgi:coenzyme F420-reducing hydrogenase alpha subunit
MRVRGGAVEDDITARICGICPVAYQLTDPPSPNGA